MTRQEIAEEIIRRADTVAILTAEEVRDIQKRTLAGEFDDIFADEVKRMTPDEKDWFNEAICYLGAFALATTDKRLSESIMVLIKDSGDQKREIAALEERCRVLEEARATWPVINGQKLTVQSKRIAELEAEVQLSNLKIEGLRRTLNLERSVLQSGIEAKDTELERLRTALEQITKLDAYEHGTAVTMAEEAVKEPKKVTQKEQSNG